MGFYTFKESDAWDFAKHSGINHRKSGNELMFQLCPYCRGGSNGKDKGTFYVNLSTGQFQCKRSKCGAKGNMLTLSKDFGFSLGREADSYYKTEASKKYRTFKKMDKIMPKQAAVEYLESRGISRGIAEKYQITTRKDNEKILVFPFFDEKGALAFVKYRNLGFQKENGGSKEWSERDCKPILFGMQQCNLENKTLILTEGQIDSLSVAEAGVENCVSVPNGKNGFTWIPHVWDWLSNFETIVVFGDNENGDITLLSEIRNRFPKQVKHVRLEDYRGCKDANEILRKFGKDAVRYAVEHAVRCENPRIKSLADVKRPTFDESDFIYSGINELDKLTGGFRKGQLVLLTGERGFGKSTLASQFATFALKQGHTVFFYSGELTDWMFKDWTDRQIAGSRYINVIERRNGFRDFSVMAEELCRIERWYREKFFIIDNSSLDEEDSEEESLLKTIENAISQYGSDVIFIDNLMTAISDDLKSDLYRSQTRFVNGLAKMARRLNVLILLVAHPRKSTGSVFSNDDIAGSSNITNLVNLVLRYDKPSNGSYDFAERVLTVIKNRDTGLTNRDKGISLFYEMSSKRISEKDGEFDWEIGWESHEFTEIPQGTFVPF